MQSNWSRNNIVFDFRYLLRIQTCLSTGIEAYSYKGKKSLHILSSYVGDTRSGPQSARLNSSGVELQSLALVKTKVQETTGVPDHHLNTQSGSSAVFSIPPTCFCLSHFPVHTAFMYKQEHLGWLLLTGRKKIPLKSPFLLEPYLGLLQCLSWYFTPPPQVREHSDHFDQADHWPWMGRGPSSPSFTH